MSLFLCSNNESKCNLHGDTDTGAQSMFAVERWNVAIQDIDLIAWSLDYIFFISRVVDIPGGKRSPQVCLFSNHTCMNILLKDANLTIGYLHELNTLSFELCVWQEKQSIYKESINIILESLGKEGFKVSESFETFSRLSVRRLGRLLPEVPWVSLL